MAFAFWIFVVLPIYYSPSDNSAAHKCSAQENENHGFWEKASCDPTAYFTLWLVAFTGVLAVSTIGLWGVTWVGIRNQRRDTEILQRAYISVEPLGVHPIQSSNRNVGHIDICNVGNLPARNVKWTIMYERSEKPRWVVPVVDEIEVEGNNVVPPGGRMRQGGAVVSIDTKIGHAVREVDQRPKPTGRFLYVWGAVFYEDGFGESRVTRFCHRYNLANVKHVVTPGMPTITGRHSLEIGAEFARYHRYGNDAT